jgi:hypothetical protein
VTRFGKFGWIVPAIALMTVLSATATGAPAAKSATPQVDDVKGIEILARDTQGTFTGYSTGSLPGDWIAVVKHTPLSPNATITGGTFRLVTSRSNATRTLIGRFTTGTITNTDAGRGCTNQTYRVVGSLAHFGGNRTGRFAVTLTHYRHQLLGSCIAYFATATGTLRVG